MDTLGQDDEGTVAATAQCLRAGGVVVIPTDTVYGLAALPTQPAAVQTLFAIKERPEAMHLPVLGASLDQVRQLGVELSDAATALAQRWWPGPLTLAFGFAKENSRPDWLAGRDEVAVRIPGHDFLLTLLEATGVLLVTSANLHGAPTAASADLVADSLGPQVALVVDGGTLSDTPSTLVNMRQGEATIERVGTLSERDITDTLAAIR